MEEHFVQYIWNHKKFDVFNLKTSAGELVSIYSSGIHNKNTSGPDFFNAKLKIGDQLWVGNVEVHIKASDWYAHAHQDNEAYDKVILHVVWENDMPVYRKDKSQIPVVQLKDFIKPALLARYQIFFENMKRKTIICEGLISSVSDFRMYHWQERLFIERLERKTVEIHRLLQKTKNDWEQVLFLLICKSFGLRINSDAFLSIGMSFDFSVFKKCQESLCQLEALFFGQAKMLPENPDSKYEKNLNKEYQFLKKKFSLTTTGVLSPLFFRLRPGNFPTIRLSQLANLYNQNNKLFHRLIHVKNIKEVYGLFSVSASDFWNNHYVFSKESSKNVEKRISKSFIDLIVINTIIPLKFLFDTMQGVDAEKNIFDLMSEVSLEKNAIIRQFESMKITMKNAIHSQAMIELKNKYCDKKACLKCDVGNYLLNR
ncbi:DUF2851 family protein [Aquimarina sp. TRL1]|uniref:DUF2851 family protein n=1 Tax=Aquimarina sp. (strain TRL1) TaxID=2736252 RepID=UPI00158EE025|nr:DUF2851 family protein [Aquimarina sp. TRL1]QKX05638.1 DUF2851 family protein [Aquimarina sp. TRL1]